MARKKKQQLPDRTPLFESRAQADAFAEELGRILTGGFVVAVCDLPTLKDGPKPFIRCLHVSATHSRCVLTIFRPTDAGRAAATARSRAKGK